MRSWLAMLGVMALVAAGCADDDLPDLTPEDLLDDVDDLDEPEEPDEAVEQELTADITVADSAFGEILVDADGLTLYLFTQDDPGVSNCTGDCAATWPPLIVDDEATAGTGIEAGLLGTTTRDDGSIQVTYADQPLYYFSADAAAGDTNGQGVGDVWFVVAPDGSAITAAGANPAGNGGRGDY